MTPSFLRIPPLPLPEQLPQLEAISSFGDAIVNYDPQFWSFQYEAYRYLERMSDQALDERHQDIIRNMRALISGERDLIPIQSFLSSWYWYRKEFQTRLEIALRGRIPTCAMSIDVRLNANSSDAPYRPQYPNSGEVLFRYSKRAYCDEALYKGRIRIQPSSIYAEASNIIARRDDERTKESFLPGGYTKITTHLGQALPILGDVSVTVSMQDYYVLSMACDWDRDLFSAFDSDACFIIKNVESFASRLESESSVRLGNFFLFHNPVEYFDPYERPVNQLFDPCFSKDFRFAYQREYRFIWVPQNIQGISGYKYLELGNLEDLAEIST